MRLAKKIDVVVLDSNLTYAIDRARARLESMGLDPYSDDTFEGLSYCFAEALVQIADKVTS